MSTTNNQTTVTGDITQDHGSVVEIVVLALSAFSLVSTIALLISRLCCKYVIQEAWKMALMFQDIANAILACGLTFFVGYVGSGIGGLCSAAGFLLLFGVLDATCMLVLVVVALLFLQNPGKLGQLSTFRRSKMAVLVVPEKLVVFVLTLVPVIPMDYFDTESPYPVACFPVRQEGGKGAAFGAILFFILWVLQILGLVLSGICAFRLWKSSSSRIHASSPNLWQAEKISQGRSLHKMLLLEQLFLIASTFTLTIVVYTNSETSEEDNSWSRTPQWVVMVALAVVALLHSGVCGVQLVLWSAACCCQTGGQRSKEPYQRLKKLELIKVEGPGKLRLRASWSAGRGVTRKGLVKVYGLNQLKGWAQEIVVLGMLRKSQNPSLLQCLWTANTNPYFETMTMLSGQIVTSESRLICLELTSSGNLQEFLGSLDIPLPEPCTRTILHDLAEGLAALHAQNILHRNLTSAAVYLKGSVQRLVLRAALGDFEEAEIYGSLQNGALVSSSSGVVSKKHFFLPDIRAFALVALEILGVVCKRRQEEKQPHRLISTSRTKSLTDATEGGTGGQTARGEAAFHGSGQGEGVFVVQKGRSKKAGSREDLMADIDDGIIPPPSPFENEYMEVGDYSREDDDDSGMSVGGDREDEGKEYYPDHRDHRHPHQRGEEGEDAPRLPPITHVRETYSYEFPNQSVFRATKEGDATDDYEEIDDIEEEIHREIRFNALNRRRLQQTGGYIVTRTTSGRELFIPHNMNVQNHHSHNSSFGNSDSGYVGTSSNASSRYPCSTESGVGGVEDPPDSTSNWPRAAHRTTSAQTISSFGDDVLEVLPGMKDEEELRKGDKSLRQMLRARDDAKVEQILQDYEVRVRTGNFSKVEKEWPKLKFSRAMQGLVVEGKAGSRPSTPRAAVTSTPKGQQDDALSPRPQTAAAGASTTEDGGKRTDKARPLSASASSTSGAWKLRSSFKKSKAHNQLVRALSRGKSIARHGNSSSKAQSAPREQRGASGKLVEQKYATHNAAFRKDEEEQNGCEQEMEVEMADEVGVNNGGDDDAYDNMHREGTNVLSPRRCGSQGQVMMPSEASEHAVMQRKAGEQNRQADKPNTALMGKLSSFSSSDSMMSCHRHHHRDTSLTSGELTSLSSQAESVRDPPVPTQAAADKRGGKEGAGTGSKAVPGLKIADSGFDEDSASVISDVSYDATAATPASPQHTSEMCMCSCQSDTVTGSGSCTCSCSGCHAPHSPGRHSESQEESSVGTWSNSNSFSSYDVQMHRRKLPATKQTNEDVLGPDEQYPSSHKPHLATSNALSPPAKHRHHRHHHPNNHHHHHRTPSHASGSSSSSKGSSSAASRRYRELTKKGVPLRVSRVDDADSPRTANLRDRLSARHPWSSGGVDEVEVIEEEEDALYQDLESQGFFDSTDSASSKNSPVRQPHGKHRPLSSAPRRIEMVQRAEDDLPRHQDPRLHHFPQLPTITSLEDIIREIPDETGGPLSGEEAKAFLNRPESELSVKALKPPAPKPPADRPPYRSHNHSHNGNTTKDVGPVEGLHRDAHLNREAELVIDRMFCQQQGHKGGGQSVMDAGMGLDEVAIRQLAMLPTITEVSTKDHDSHSQEGPPLLRGTDSKHVRYVETLNDRAGGFLCSDELLPADPRSFEKLRRRLQHSGNFGTIGVKLLDIIGACWVKEIPPSTADIVDQLTDHVTETEL